MCPGAKVVYNDHDGFAGRIAKIPQTNAILARLRSILCDYPIKKRITGETRTRVMDLLKSIRNDNPDWITLSASLRFSGNFATSFEDFLHADLWNRVRKTDFELSEDYLDGLCIVSLDWRELFGRYRDASDAVFIVDPPYLSTDVSSYDMKSWKLSTYLDILSTMDGRKFFYFTSDKSGITDLYEWMHKKMFVTNPLEECRIFKRGNPINWGAGYHDMMFVSSGIAPASV